MKYVDTAANGHAVTVSGLVKNTKLIDVKVESNSGNVINVSDKGAATVYVANKDRNLYTAYQVTLASNVTAALNDKDKTPVFTSNYVAAGEKLVLTFPEACKDKDYTISVGGEVVKTIVKAVKDQTVTVTVDGAVTVAEVKYMTAAEVEKTVDDAVKAKFGNDYKLEVNGIAELKVEGDTLTVAFENGKAIEDLAGKNQTGLMVLAKSLLDGGNEITVELPNGRVTLNGTMQTGNILTALSKYVELDGNEPAAGESVQYAVTVTNTASGESVDYTVVLAQAKAEA